MVKEKLPNAESIKEVTDRLDGKDYQVTKVEKKERKRNPSAPLQPVVFNKRQPAN